MLEFLLPLFIGLVIGTLIGYLAKRGKAPASETNLEESLKQLRNEKEKVAIDKGELEGRLKKSLEVFEEQKLALSERDGEVRRLSGMVERLEADKENLGEKLKNQTDEIEKLNQRFKVEFENLANEILKRNTKDFTETNNKQIGDILSPLKERIERFEKRVNEVYENEAKDRSKLAGQVSSLMELNKKISEEANNLTRALKSDTKKQGTWGELILEKILESSGLERDVEYSVEYSRTTEEGRMKRPDVVIKLPEDKFIIVDSKVSLIAYERYVNAEEVDRESYLQQHVQSIKTHIKSLSEKNYSGSIGLNSPDFVLMFIPIEPGFSEALKYDGGLYNLAWDSRIIIVSPTTLLATLRTVASLWKQEKQNRNVMAIAQESGKLYDKFVGFVEDLDKIKRGVKQTSDAYDAAMNKLQSGTGNLIRRAEKIKALGAKASKNLPQELLDEAEG